MIRLQFYVPHDITRRNEILNCAVIVIMLENMLPYVKYDIVAAKTKSKRIEI